MQTFTIMSNEIEGRLSPAYYKNKNPFLQSKYEIINLEDYFIVNPKFQNKNNLKIVSFLPMKNINPDLQEVEKFDKIEIEKIKGYTPFEEGDLVFAKVTPCMENGNLAICENMPFKIGVGTSEIYVFREKQKDKIPNKLLKLLFSLDKFRQFAKNNFTGTGGLQRVPRDFFNNLKIPLPPLEIQNKIIQLMDSAYSSKKQKETEALKLLDSINDYVLDELGINFSPINEDKVYCIDSSELENNRNDPYYFNPKFKRLLADLDKSKIKLAKLKDIVETIFSGKTPAKEDYAEEGNLILKVKCLKNNKIRWDNLSYFKGNIPAVKTIKDKDVLLLSSAHQSEYLGKNPSIVEIPQNLKDKKIFFVGELINIRANTEKINPYYILAILKLNEYYLFINREKRGQTSHLYPEDLGNVKIPLPPLSIQNKIAEEVKKRIQKAEQLQKDAKEELEKAKLEVERIILS